MGVRKLSKCTPQGSVPHKKKSNKDKDTQQDNKRSLIYPLSLLFSDKDAGGGGGGARSHNMKNPGSLPFKYTFPMALSFHVGGGGGGAAEKWVSFTLLRLSEIEKEKQREYSKVVIGSCGPVNHRRIVWTEGYPWRDFKAGNLGRVPR